MGLDVPLTLLLLPASTWAFQPGAVCVGANYSTPARSMLVGKHLILKDSPWFPFAIKDASKPHGWDGLDVDLVSAVAAKLGFTFDILEMTPAPGETWTRMLFDEVDRADMMLSYWARTTDRLERVAMLSGHVDMSNVLVGSLSTGTGEAGSSWVQVFSFLRPFSLSLWGCLFGMVLLSGVVDFVLERGSPTAAGLFSSLYEYFAGTLWGGFEYPRSRPSAIYQITLGFLLLVAISAYTANLAAAMTAQTLPGLSISSIEEGLVANTPTCSYPNPMLEEIDALYPTLAYKMLNSNGDVAKRLREGVAATADDGNPLVCEAAVVPRVTFDIWKMDAQNCDLEIATSVLGARSAGWATNRRSPCVQQAVEVALSEMRNDGSLEMLLQKWLRPASCTAAPLASPSSASSSAASSSASSSSSSEEEEEEEDTRLRRRLEGQDGATVPRRGVGRGGAALRRGRHLKGGSGEGSAAASGAVSDQEVIANGVRVVQLADFAGVFIVWGATTLLVLAWSWLSKRRQRDVCMKGCGGGRAVRIAPPMRPGRHAPRRPGIPPQLHAQLARLRLKGTGATSGAPGRPKGWDSTRATKTALAALKAMAPRDHEDLRAANAGEADPFDLSKVNPNDVNGMVFRIMRQLGDMRNEMRQMEHGRTAKAHLDGGTNDHGVRPQRTMVVELHPDDHDVSKSAA